MPRKKHVPVLAKHVDPEKAAERNAKTIRRARARSKPRVVAGTAVARALGIK